MADKAQTVQSTPAIVKQTPVVSKDAKPTPAFSMFMAGIAGCITVSFIHPIDVVKTWMQTHVGQRMSIGGAISGIRATAGFGAFYKGLSAAYLRESVYTSTRIGLYEHAKNLVGGGKNAAIWQKIAAGALSGALGSLLGNPFDVLKTRMMADAKASRSVFSHVNEIVGSNGFKGLYRGLDANIMRAMVLNSTKMATYDETKTQIKKAFGWKDGVLLQTASSGVAGFFMAITVTPFDMVRTRLMNQPKDQILYTGMVDAFAKITASEGLGAIYKGFIPVWGRFAPTTTLQLIIFEAIRKYFGIEAL